MVSAVPRRRVRWSVLIERMGNYVLAMPQPAKRAVACCIDIVLCVLATWIAFYLRLGVWIMLSGNQWISVILAIALSVPIFTLAGVYRTIFRYSGAAALLTITQATLVYGVVYATIITVIQIDAVPRTVGIIQPVLAFLFIATSRVVASWWLGGNYARLVKRKPDRAVMIYGAGSAGRQLFQALMTTEMRVRGFIDDDPMLHGRVLLGKPIYSADDIAGLVRRHTLSDILLALPSASRKRRSEILSMIGPLAVAVRTIPGLVDVAQGLVRIEDIRELDIDDLLGRDAVAPDQTLLARNNRDKVVLVTGAGGSIGSELCRQILAVDPAVLVLVELSEPALYAIHRELEGWLANREWQPKIVPILASVCDAVHIDQIVEAWRPDTIYHAAAYKHVPLVEHNPAVGVWNNVFGTMAMAQAACRHGVSDFVFISTDKAVRPTNVMGTTKRLAEQVLQALAATQSTTRLSMVRFGNVLGSSGSVVPLFRRQIEAGGPITITHPEITRYFMTISEAAQLVIQAGAMASGGEVFVLDMGSPVKIVTLAKMMVELSGATLRSSDKPDGDIEIEYIGLRPGEKLYEELLIGNDPSITDHPRIMKASESFLPWGSLSAELETLRAQVRGREVEPLIATLQRLVPEYAAESSLVDWLHIKRSEDRGADVVGVGMQSKEAE